VTIAAILSLVGVIVGIVTSTISNVSGIVTSSTGTSGVSISLPSPWVWVGLVGISVAIEIAGLVMFRSAFRTLARVDRRFSTPAMLALAAIASFVVILLGLGLLLGALYQAVQCVGSGNPITGACLFTGTFWAGIALLVVGGLVALVGFIGVLIGIWRLGTRYSETTFKLGAVLSIIPYLNIAGAILILAGAHSVRGRLERTGAPSPPSAPWR
jgi:hypothetical protein